MVFFNSHSTEDDEGRPAVSGFFWKMFSNDWQIGLFGVGLYPYTCSSGWKACTVFIVWLGEDVANPCVGAWKSPTLAMPFDWWRSGWWSDMFVGGVTSDFLLRRSSNGCILSDDGPDLENILWLTRAHAFLNSSSSLMVKNTKTVNLGEGQTFRLLGWGANGSRLLLNSLY